MGNVFLSSRNLRFRFSSVRADSKSLRHSYRYEVEKQIDENQPQGTVNDLINARGVNLILGVQVGAFNRWEAFKRERRLFS